MKTFIIASAALALGSTVAFAQGGATGTPPAGATPTCAQALPQINDLVSQAQAGGLEVTPAKGHVSEAETAKANNDEAGCINALVLAQNTILEQVQNQQPANKG